MKRILVIGVLLLAGCTSAQSPSASLQNAKGYGGITQGTDGVRRFSWMIPSNAYAGLLPPAKHEDQRETMLAAWIGSEKACPGAWRVTDRSEANGMIYFNGVCS